MTTTINATIENLHTNKRKFLSDAEVYPPSARILSINKQVETSSNTKRIKSVDVERLPSPAVDVHDDDDMMMICENSDNLQQTNHATKQSQAILIPKHCNGLCNADASPTTLFIRCYCDPYRFNEVVPYKSDIY